MFKTQQIVSGIRSVLQRDNQALTDDMHRLADEYVEACRSVNDRLRFCGAYLAQGLRGEALQVAETSPALLDEVSVLDFPELEHWQELCDDYMLPYEWLLMDVAEELNHAYNGFETLDRLLRNYRRSNLMESPLNQRLAHLRKLAAFDRDAEHWYEDLAEFESVRLREIDDEMRQAARGGDLEHLLCLKEEVRMETWVAPVPARLVRNVDQAVERVRGHQPEGKQHRTHLLARITNALEAAIRSGDLSRTESVARQWHQVAGLSGLPADAPTRARGRRLLSEMREPVSSNSSV